MVGGDQRCALGNVFSSFDIGTNAGQPSQSEKKGMAPYLRGHACTANAAEQKWPQHCAQHNCDGEHVAKEYDAADHRHGRAFAPMGYQGELVQHSRHIVK